MMHFRQTVLIQIKSASNETELEDVVSDSIQRLKIKNVHGHIIQRFISGMEQTLDRERTDQLSTKALKNMDRARDLFRKLLKP
jgi:hypothetical protein